MSQGQHCAVSHVSGVPAAGLHQVDRPVSVDLHLVHQLGGATAGTGCNGMIVFLLPCKTKGPICSILVSCCYETKPHPVRDVTCIYARILEIVILSSRCDHSKRQLLSISD